jgi:hypothetical protein
MFIAEERGKIKEENNLIPTVHYNIKKLTLFKSFVVVEKIPCYLTENLYSYFINKHKKIE